MAELTKREQKIVHIMHILINKSLESVPHDVRVNALKSQLLIRGFEFDEEEIKDIVLAINRETTETIQNAYAMLHKFGPQLKDLNKLF